VPAGMLSAWADAVVEAPAVGDAASDAAAVGARTVRVALALFATTTVPSGVTARRPGSLPAATVRVTSEAPVGMADRVGPHCS
jgi:hypothetical protein